MDRLANLEAFAEAAERGSFTLAAQRLRLTPSAVSRRVAQLEAELGVTLFHRTTRALRLSEEGRELLERTRGALRELKDAAEAATASRRKPSGLLRVEAPTILGRDVVVPAVAELIGRHPGLEVELVLRDHPSDLVSEGIDAAIRLGALHSPGQIARKLGSTRMSVCGAPGYLRRRGTPRTVDALSRHERLGFTALGRSIPWRLRDGDRIREVPPGRKIACNSADALIDLAVAGAGLIWVCDFMIARARRSGALVEVLEGAACDEVPVHLVSLPGRNVLPKVRAFGEQVIAELARTRPR